MSDELNLNKPWLVAAWPGMGHVAVSAGYYLISKLDMRLMAELPTEDVFDVEHIEVKGGIIRPGRMPRSRFFGWRDPAGRRDLIVFIGEAQPTRGKYAFCQDLVDQAQALGVERIFTFAAMATEMHPSAETRLFTAATDEHDLADLCEHGLEVLEDGQIGGLNGLLLGAAAEKGVRGACVLGEMPHIFAQLPFPKASLAVLDVFAKITGISIDLSELAEQAREMNEQVGELLGQMNQAIGQQGATEEENENEAPEARELGQQDARRLESLFVKAENDRSTAYELKRELDRLGVYRDYEDRFLDLFKKGRPE